MLAGLQTQQWPSDVQSMFAMMDLSLSWSESSICHGRHCWPTRIIATWPLDSNSWNPPSVLLLLLLFVLLVCCPWSPCGAVLRRDCALRRRHHSTRITWTRRSFQCFFSFFFYLANFANCCWLTWILQFSQTSQNKRVDGKQQRRLNCFSVGKEIWFNFLVTILSSDIYWGGGGV